MNYYVLSMVGWEDYAPNWFECDCTKEAFDASVKYAIGRGINYLIDIEKDEDFIGGYDLIEQAIRFLEEDGYKLIITNGKIQHEIIIP